MNDKLAEIHKDLALKDAFSKADDVLAKAVKSVVDVIAKPGDVNTDFMDVKKVLKNAGQAMMSSALGQGEERALMAISDALESPLLNSQEIKGAKRILVTVSTSSKRDLVMSEQDIIVEYLQARHTIFVFINRSCSLFICCCSICCAKRVSKGFGTVPNRKGL